MTSRPYSFSGISTPEAEPSSGVWVVEEAQAASRRSATIEYVISAASRISPPPPLRIVGQYPARGSLPQAGGWPHDTTSYRICWRLAGRGQQTYRDSRRLALWRSTTLTVSGSRTAPA